MTRYPLANPGVFKTLQGEGSLLGYPSVFVRLAGCSVGCPGCDTDYGVSERLTADEIRHEVQALYGKEQWIWLTGGEPADHDLYELLIALRRCGKLALATSGAKYIGHLARLIYFLSVSPHGKPADLRVTSGQQLNLVPGLNGLRLQDWDTFDASGFEHRWVTPLWTAAGPLHLAECVAFAEAHPGWRVGVQAHKAWGLP